jgi:DNA-binding NtrC family response regulator
VNRQLLEEAITGRAQTIHLLVSDATDGQAFVAGAIMRGLGANPKVLIVDDEKNICATLAAIFASRGYEVRVAYSAEQAVEVIAERQPGLAILDVGLPKMNGIDLAIVLESSQPACRVLLFSGQPSTSDLLEQAAQGGHLFEILAKPVPPNLLPDTIANLLSVSREETVGTPADL